MTKIYFQGASKVLARMLSCSYPLPEPIQEVQASMPDLVHKIKLLGQSLVVANWCSKNSLQITGDLSQLHSYRRIQASNCRLRKGPLTFL